MGIFPFRPHAFSFSAGSAVSSIPGAGEVEDEDGVCANAGPEAGGCEGEPTIFFIYSLLL